MGCSNFLAFCCINPTLPFLSVPAVRSSKAAHIVPLYLFIYLLVRSCEALEREVELLLLAQNQK